MNGSHHSWINFILEWQISHDTENTEKSPKLSTKQKTLEIMENSVFATQNKRYLRKPFLQYLKVKFIIKNLKLFLINLFRKNLLLKFNKKIYPLSVHVV